MARAILLTGIGTVVLGAAHCWGGFDVPRHVKAPAEMEAVLAEAQSEGKSVMIVRSDPGTN